jgi:hypothetical protein
MGIEKHTRVAESKPVEEIRRLVAALTDASTRRHRLERGTAEYDAALETEERLADDVWRLGASLGPPGEPSVVQERPNKPDA